MNIYNHVKQFFKKQRYLQNTRIIQVQKKIDHPNIPDYFRHFKISINGEIFYILVQEYVHGKNIHEQIKAGEQFTVEETQDDVLSQKLFEAVLNNNTELVKELIEGGADVNVDELLDKQLLLIAFKNDNLEIAKMLIENGANINKYYKGMAALSTVVISGKINHVKLLLDYGAAVNLKDTNGKSPIEYAYQNSYKRIIALLLKYSAMDKVAEEKRDSHINLESPPRKLSIKEKCLIRKRRTGNSFGLGLFLALQGQVVNVESTNSSENDTSSL